MRQFFVFILLAYFAASVYVFVRIRQALPDISAVRIVFYVSFVSVALSLFAALIFRDTLPANLLKIMYLVGSTWLVLLLYMTMVFLIIDVIYLINNHLHFIQDTVFSLNLRQRQVLTACIGVVIVLFIGYYKFNKPIINEKDITIHKNFSLKNNLKIVAISDLHLGSGIGKQRLQKYVEMINAQNPDIVLIAGDLLDSSPRPLLEQRMYEDIDKIAAPLGIYMCFGNHEHISNDQSSLNFIKKTKIVPLFDSIAQIGNLSIIGRKDYSTTNRLTLNELTKNIPAENIKILLDHQPYNLNEAKENSIDLQISGHTHDGQFFPINLIVKNIFELSHGYMQKSDTHYIVSSGLGLWGPHFRIGTQSELWVVNLTFDENK